MADSVEFELVSPEKLLLSKAVEMVVVPGTEGDFGVCRAMRPFSPPFAPASSTGL